MEIMTLITEIQNEARSIPRPIQHAPGALLYILSVEAWVRNEGVKVVRAGDYESV